MVISMNNSSHTYNIIKNSVFLFVRMLIIMFINLYAVRLIVRGMGMELYGVYQAVAGVVLILSGVSTVISTSAQRYLSIAIGQNDTLLLKKTFCTNVHVTIIFCAILFLLFETIGIYAIHHWLQFPEEVANQVFWLYQISIFAFCITFIQIPFQALVLAREDMQTFSLISLAECVLKCGAAYMLTLWFTQYPLVVYSVMLAGIAVCSLCTYMYIYYRQGSLYIKTYDRSFHREVIIFSFWMLFGSCASAVMSYGNTTLLNIYFGPLINAAYAIALQVSTAFNSFSSSISMAIRPAMISAYGGKDYGYMERIFAVSNKTLYFCLLFMAIPIWFALAQIFDLWLGEYDQNTILFTRLMIIYTIILSLNNPISIIVHATGEVRKYVFYVETLMLLCFPICWILFHYGSSPVKAMYVMLSICLLAHAVRLFCLKQVYSHFSIRSYIKNFVLRAVIITIGLGSIGWGLFQLGCSLLPFLLLYIVIAGPIYAILIAYIGMESKERQLFIDFLKRDKSYNK